MRSAGREWHGPSAAEIAEALGARSTGPGEWLARCPVPGHEDADPSFGISEGSGGVPLVHCRSRCTQEQAIDALRHRGLWSGGRDGYARSRAASWLPGTRPPGVPDVLSKTGARFTACWPYRDAGGEILGFVARFDRPDGDKDYLPFFACVGGRWTAKAAPKPRPLFGLERLAACPEAAVLVVEGEKACTAAQKLWPGMVVITSPGGAKSPKAADWGPLAGRHVIVWPDADQPGRRYAADVADLARKAGAAAVLLVPVPEAWPQGWDLADPPPEGADLDALLAAAAPVADAQEPRRRPKRSDGTADPRDTRPEIRITTEIKAVVDAAEDAIIGLGPVIFQRGGILVRIVRGGAPPPGLARPPGALSIAPAPLSHLAEQASLAARWTRYDARAGAQVPARPPEWAMKCLAERGEYRVPYLAAIVETPVLRPDGSVLERPGYDAGTGLFLDPGGVDYPAVPDRPTPAQVKQAVDALCEVFIDFSFVDPETGMAAAIAAFLTLLSRSAIDGPVPLFLVVAVVAGSGKTLLVDVLSILATGRPAPRWTQADEAEDRKRLIAIAVEGDPLVLIDNIKGSLGSTALDAALTSEFIKDRILGSTRSISAPWRAVLFGTGNNIAVRGDLARRVVPIDLDPRVERPEERVGFRHSPLLPWVRRERPRLVAAALTILRAYHVAGRPSQSLPPVGSFEAWSDLARAAIVWAGAADPCAGRERIREEADPEREGLREALQAWHEVLKSQPWTLADIITKIETAGPGSGSEDLSVLRGALAGLDPKYDGKTLNARRIGAALKRHRGRIVDGMCFEAGEKAKAGVPWKVTQVTFVTLAHTYAGECQKDEKRGKDRSGIKAAAESLSSPESPGKTPLLALAASASPGRVRV